MRRAQLPPSGGSGHRRELQRTAATADTVVITVLATAPTVAEAEAAIDHLRAQAVTSPRTGNSTCTHRRLQGSMTASEQSAAECAVGMSASCAAVSQVTQVTQSATGRAEVEALAAEKYGATIGRRRQLQRGNGGADTGLAPGSGLQAPPTLDNMLVAGSPAADLLSSLFTSEQQPHLAFPAAIEAVGTTATATRVTMQAAAPTTEGAEAAAAELLMFLTNARR